MKTRATWMSVLPMLLCFFQIHTHAQQADCIPEKGSFVIQGKAVHIPKDVTSFQLAVKNLFRGESFTVPFRKDGTFQMQLPVRGRQDMYLYLGDAITVSVCPDDTLRLLFDYADCPASVCLAGTTHERTNELKLELELDRKYRQSFLDLSEEGRRPGALSDTLFVRKVKQYIDGYRNDIQLFEKQHGPLSHKDYLLYRGYFDGITVSSIAANPNVLASTFFQQKIRCFDGEQTEKLPIYQAPDFNFFQSPSALKFAQSYIHSRMFPLLYMWRGDDTDTRWNRIITLTEACIPNKSLREWYLVSFFLLEVNINQEGKLQELKGAGERILRLLTIPAMKEQMQQLMDTYFNRMSPGQWAPDFTLTDENGNPVSLSSLKGKVVYLDIWAIGCGPCVREFRLSEKLHEKYAEYEEHIAYVYVCVGSTDKQWKKALKNFRLKGIHLHAPTGKEEGFAAYNGDFFPLYVLIDKEGRIAEYNSPLRPSVLLTDKPNLLDELLKPFRK